MSELPVIFLAFANDRKDYLYKLTEEQNAIREALDKVSGPNIPQENRLCEVIYETDTDLNKIWKTFDRYKDRISIFHYGGHASDYALLLKQASGEREMANAGGLVTFLGQQKGLKLVFINGCSSRRQAMELRDKGVPAVIGTSRPINDSIATTLSRQFYVSLAEGRSLEQAWEGAQAQVTAKRKKESKTRDFVFNFNLETEDMIETPDFPWDLYIRAGAEHIKSWNLAREAYNPLFNLPLPDRYYLSLKNSPFVGLHFFQEADSALFFGRATQIRELYNHLQGIHPIILFYGKSGVGKSSMLDAGLLPRIKDSYQIIYTRRIQEKGLLGTLEMALDGQLTERIYLEEIASEQSEQSEQGSSHQEPPQAQAELEQLLLYAIEKSTDSVLRQQLENALSRLIQTREESKKRKTASVSPDQLTTILSKWQGIEQQEGKPLVIILDQVEEKYTRPMPGSASTEDELIQFLMAIQPLFGQNQTNIKGKLILSYRKESHPEIRDSFQALRLPYAELFLKRLDRAGIIEAIQGVNQHDITRRKYQLQIEDNLPEIIADDLMEDSESPIAPVLQITLAKLWTTSHQAEHQPVPFSRHVYQELRKEGITIGEFFQQQMDKLAKLKVEETTYEQEVKSGLTLDILHQHTTNLGTAGSCKRADLLNQYEVEGEKLKKLIQELQNLSLLVRLDQQKARASGKREENYTTILAHDTLAPIVIRAFNLSDTPGQRAARILNNKLADVGYRLSQEDINKILASHSLNTQSEQSEYALPAELEQEYIGPANFIAMLRPHLKEDLDGKIEQDMLARARINLNVGKEESYLAEADLAIVEEGAGIETGSLPGMPKLSSAGQKLIDLSRQKRAERIVREQANRRRQQIFTAAITVALLIATGLGIWAYSSKVKADQKTREAQSAALAAKARQVYEEDPTIAINLAMAAHTQFPSQETQSAIHDLSEDPLVSYYQTKHTIGDTAEYISMAFSSDELHILTSHDTTAKLWDRKGNFLLDFNGHTNTVMSVAFSPSGQNVLTGSKDNTARLWDLEGNLIQEFKGHKEMIWSVAFSPDGQNFLTGSLDQTARLWNLQGRLLQEFKGHKGFVSSLAFSPNGKSILTGSWDNIVRLWDRNGNLLQEFKGHRGIISTLVFSPDGKNILTGSSDRTSLLWDLKGNSLQQFNGHTNDITSLAFSPDGKNILTGSYDKTALLWDLQGNSLMKFKGHTSSILSLAFSSDGKSVVTGSGDRTVRQWDLKANPLQQFKGHTKPVIFVAFSSNSQSVLTGSYDKTILLWDLEGKPLKQQQVKAQKELFHSVVFSPNDKNFLIGSYDGTVGLWDLKGNLLQHFMGHTATVSSVVFSPTGQNVLTGSWDQTAILWDLNGNPLQKFKGHSDFVSSVALSPNGQNVLTGSWDRTAMLWDLKGKLLQHFKGHTGQVSSVAFSPDGKSILTGSNDKTARLWSLKGKLNQQFLGHSSEIHAIAFSPDGQRILTGSGDGTRLWDLKGNQIQTFDGNSGVSSVAFSSDGNYLLTGGQLAKLWQTVYQRWEKGEIYKLSEKEWAKYGIDWAY
ncbi:MAG: AAA family ATPase [Bacteroidota bacterium]